HKQQSSTRQEEELFSRSEALKLAADNIELANELTNMLIEELPSYLQSINDALAKHNIKQLRHDTHKLHGAARCCGTLALRQAAERLESDIDNNNSETLEPSSHQLIDEIERLINTDQSTFML
ncbi:MAG: Hpt domain-containing protein, partial [Gammaproteobacteria bacterium]|nr:Hpt domain-containing protein [Gammaproteobacteria bacterium]